MSTRLVRAVAHAAVASWLGLALAACADRPSPTASPPLAEVSKSLTVPTPLFTVADVLGHSVELWPYTANDFSGAPADPMNLGFFGAAEPRALRAALLFLDGDRSGVGFPNVFPFNCTWHDVPEGNVQAAYGPDKGWVGGVIQLACGDFGPVRFHVRFFDLGGGTAGGAHFELQVPGTTTHQVLSWELAQLLVTADFARTGLLGAPPGASAQINDAPSYGEIAAVIYNGLPPELRAAIGGPAGNQGTPVPIPSDGMATILTLAGTEEGLPLVARQRFAIDFNQTIPKPFCQSGPYDALLVQGPITLTQHVVFTPAGNFLSTFQARGHLDLTPVYPPGEPYRAEVNEQHHAILTDNVSLASSFQMQLEIPSRGPFRGRLVTRITVGPGSASLSELTVRCLP